MEVSRYLWGNSKLGDENENDPCGGGGWGRACLRDHWGSGSSDKNTGHIIALQREAELGGRESWLGSEDFFSPFIFFLMDKMYFFFKFYT